MRVEKKVCVRCGKRPIKSKIMYRAKSQNDISDQRDRLKILNRENVKRNPKVKNRVEEINLAASMSRAVRRFSIFSPDKDSKRTGVFFHNAR